MAWVHMYIHQIFPVTHYMCTHYYVRYCVLMKFPYLDRYLFPFSSHSQQVPVNIARGNVQKRCGPSLAPLDENDHREWENTDMKAGRSCISGMRTPILIGVETCGRQLWMESRVKCICLGELMQRRTREATSLARTVVHTHILKICGAKAFKKNIYIYILDMII